MHSEGEERRERGMLQPVVRGGTEGWETRKRGGRGAYPVEERKMNNGRGDVEK